LKSQTTTRHSTLQNMQPRKLIMWDKICMWQNRVFSTTIARSNEDGVNFLPKMPEFNHTPAPYNHVYHMNIELCLGLLRTFNNVLNV